MSNFMNAIVLIGFVALCLAVARGWTDIRERERMQEILIEARRVPGRTDTWQA